ncbi:hypothetical protein ACAF60_10410 [Klebsiella aerogenes]|uniref:hypothetical protein n=1 Tax=Klebsiella aerogenes TaxID=548 RepID=UPI00309CE0E6|nr:hypothetical protein [Klebsiella aerogenes]
MNKKAPHMRGYWLNIMALLGGIKKLYSKAIWQKKHPDLELDISSALKCQENVITSVLT